MHDEFGACEEMARPLGDLHVSAATHEELGAKLERRPEMRLVLIGPNLEDGRGMTILRI